MSRRRKPFTLAERRGGSQHQVPHRPVTGWGAGDLPAPWAAGDVVRIDQDRTSFDREFLSRLSPHGIDGRTWWPPKSMADGQITYRHGYFVIDTAFSIGEGDEWYFRVTTVESPWVSGRLHVIPDVVDFMEPFELIDTLDPDGLALRERMLADGWTRPSDPQEHPAR